MRAVSVYVGYLPAAFGVLDAGDADQVVSFREGGVVVIQTLGGRILVGAPDRPRYIGRAELADSVCIEEVGICALCATDEVVGGYAAVTAG